MTANNAGCIIFDILDDRTPFLNGPRDGFFKAFSKEIFIGSIRALQGLTENLVDVRTLALDSSETFTFDSVLFSVFLRVSKLRNRFYKALLGVTAHRVVGPSTFECSLRLSCVL